MIDFQAAQREINLVDFLCSKYNFQLDKNKSSNSGFAVLSDGSETILVKKQTSGTFAGQWYWMDSNNQSNKGNIISFVCNRENLNIKSDDKSEKIESLKKLESILSDTTSISVFYTPIEVSSDDLEGKRAEKNKVLKLTDRNFLYSRGITDQTIDSFNFKGKIFNKWAKDVVRENFYLNTSFPMFNEIAPGPFSAPEKGQGISLEKCTGLEIKNSNFGSGNVYSTFCDKSNSLWMSNWNGEFPKSVSIFEGALDAISYYQLFKIDNNETGFLSVGGEIAEGQLSFLNKFIEKAIEINLGCDNDKAGKYFNSQILISQMKNFCDNISIVKVGKYHVKINMENAVFQKLKNRGVLSDIDLLSEGNLIKELTLPYDVLNMQKIESFLIDIINELNPFVKFQILEPILKDFNDDLMKSLGIIKEKVTQEGARINNKI